MAATKSRKKAFNWTGITDNGDGTFNAEGKREKTRLLKEFHRQGVAVRSKKIAGDGYLVSAVGSVAKPRLGPHPSLRPRTIPQRRINRPMYRGIPRVRPMRALPPNYRAPPRIRGPSAVGFTPGGTPMISGKPGVIRQWLHNRAQQRQRPNPGQMARQVEYERVQKSHETVNPQQYKTPAGPDRASMEKHEEAQRLKQIRHAEFESRRQVRAQQRQAEYEKAQKPPQESPQMRAYLEAARTNQVTGGE